MENKKGKLQVLPGKAINILLLMLVSSILFLCGCSRSSEVTEPPRILSFWQEPNTVGFSLIQEDGTLIGSRAYMDTEVDFIVSLDRSSVVWVTETGELWFAQLESGQVTAECLTEDAGEWMEWLQVTESPYEYQIIDTKLCQDKLYLVQRQPAYSCLSRIVMLDFADGEAETVIENKRSVGDEVRYSGGDDCIYMMDQRDIWKYDLLSGEEKFCMKDGASYWFCPPYSIVGQCLGEEACELQVYDYEKQQEVGVFQITPFCVSLQVREAFLYYIGMDRNVHAVNAAGDENVFDCCGRADGEIQCMKDGFWVECSGGEQGYGELFFSYEESEPVCWFPKR